MNPLASALLLLGGALAALAGWGILRFPNTATRLHAAGKATPVAFIVAAFGAGIEVDWIGRSQLLVAVVAMLVTLPVGVHLLFRAHLREEIAARSERGDPDTASSSLQPDDS